MNNNAFIVQVFENGQPVLVKGYSTPGPAKARGTRFLKDKYAKHPRGVKVFEADLLTLELTLVDERGTFTSTPLPGQFTLF